MGSMAYNREHTKTYLLRFNCKTDKDIIEKLNHVENKMGYLKYLIREDLKCPVPKNATCEDSKHEDGNM